MRTCECKEWLCWALRRKWSALHCFSRRSRLNHDRDLPVRKPYPGAFMPRHLQCIHSMDLFYRAHLIYMLISRLFFQEAIDHCWKLHKQKNKRRVMQQCRRCLLHMKLFGNVRSLNVGCFWVKCRKSNICNIRRQ